MWRTHNPEELSPHIYTRDPRPCAIFIYGAEIGGLQVFSHNQNEHEDKTPSKCCMALKDHAPISFECVKRCVVHRDHRRIGFACVVGKKPKTPNLNLKMDDLCTEITDALVLRAWSAKTRRPPIWTSRLTTTQGGKRRSGISGVYQWYSLYPAGHIAVKVWPLGTKSCMRMMIWCRLPQMVVQMPHVAHLSLTKTNKKFWQIRHIVAPWLI